MLSRHFRRAHEAKRVTARNQGLPIDEIDVLWLTAGLRCDDRSVAMTAATLPAPAHRGGGRLLWTPKARRDFLLINVQDRGAASCPFTGSPTPVANVPGKSRIVFRTVKSKPLLIDPTRKLAETAVHELPVAWEESGAWHECEQQNAGGICPSEKGA
jgi:hypothetical protein